jgi:hypothetical protein
MRQLLAYAKQLEEHLPSNAQLPEHNANVNHLKGYMKQLKEVKPSNSLFPKQIRKRISRFRIIRISYANSSGGGSSS